MSNYVKPQLKKGQAFCEGCGAICIDWSVKPILVDGQFFNACKRCQQEHSNGTFVPLCYKQSKP